MIYDCGGPLARYQVIETTNAPPGAPNPYPLEPGPLVPVDPGRFDRPKSGRVFEGLVASRQRELDELGGATSVHEQTIALASSPAALESGYRHTIVPAASRLAGERAAIGALLPTQVLTTIDGHGGVIRSNRGEIPREDQLIPYEPNYNPGTPPRDRDGGDDGMTQV